MVESRGFRPVELIIGSLVGIIGLCYLIEMFIAPVDWGAAAYHSVVPELPDAEALLISVGIIGATVMPHAVYLHSGLTQARTPGRDEHERRLLVRISNHEVVIALAIAGLVNMAMVMMASSAFHAGHPDVAEIETAYHTLAPLLGIGAAGIFLLSLIASGVSSSVVGTMAGQMIMQGFVGFRIPIWLRRVITMVPAFVVVAYGVNATNALVVSQVVLEHRAAAADDRAADVHRPRRHHGRSSSTAGSPASRPWSATVLVLVLNAFLIVQTLGVPSGSEIAALRPGSSPTAAAVPAAGSGLCSPSCASPAPNSRDRRKAAPCAWRARCGRGSSACRASARRRPDRRTNRPSTARR